MMIVMPFLSYWLSPCLRGCFVIWWDADFGPRMIPYIDSHSHIHSLGWDAWELPLTHIRQVALANTNAFCGLGLAVPPDSR